MRLHTMPSDEAVLRQISAPVSTDAYLDTLLDALADHSIVSNGYGLSAIQLGKPLRVFAMVPERIGIKAPQFIMNPRYVAQSQYTVVEEEGCLSLPHLFYRVRRPYSCTIQYTDPKTNDVHTLYARSLLARVIQHEMDHLDGKIITDIAEAHVA